MKRFLFIAGVAVGLPFVLWNCAVPVGLVAPKPSNFMVKNSGYSLGDLEEGHGIYMRKCAECHDYRIPGGYPTVERHKIVSGMSHSAGLSKAEEKSVQKYLDAASDR